jgi:hypothetical protein
MAVTRSNEPISSLFEGSLYDGLDIKATIRSVTAGEKKYISENPLLQGKHFRPMVKDLNQRFLFLKMHRPILNRHGLSLLPERI